MTFNGILYHVADEVATITFNRPEVSNGFNIPMCEEILEAIELAAKDESVKFLVINANGKVFSVGGDLAEMQRAVSDDDVQSLVKIAELVNDISFAMKRLPKPIIMNVDDSSWLCRLWYDHSGGWPSAHCLSAPLPRELECSY